MRRSLSAVVAVLAVVAMAIPASATEVTRTPLPPSGTVVFSGLCGFDVQLDLVNHETQTSFLNGNGTLVKQIITGSSFGTLTNLKSGKTIKEQFNGPGLFTFNPDGSTTLVLDGPQGFPVPLLGIGVVPLTSLAVGQGHLVYNISPTGDITLVSKTGSFRDVCPLLS